MSKLKLKSMMTNLLIELLSPRSNFKTIIMLSAQNSSVELVNRQLFTFKQQVKYSHFKVVANDCAETFS